MREGTFTEVIWTRNASLVTYDLIASAFVFWHGWTLHGFWWGVWYGLMWEAYLCNALAHWLFKAVLS